MRILRRYLIAAREGAERERERSEGETLEMVLEVLELNPRGRKGWLKRTNVTVRMPWTCDRTVQIVSSGSKPVREGLMRLGIYLGPPFGLPFLEVDPSHSLVITVAMVVR